MTHWRSMIDRQWLYAFDLQGKAVNVQIERVVGGEVVGVGGKKNRKPILHFRGKDKPLVCNATNAKTIASITGSEHIEQWVGAWITLYPTTTADKTNGGTIDCIRVKPKAPRMDAGKPREPEQPPAGEAHADSPPPDDWQPSEGAPR